VLLAACGVKRPPVALPALAFAAPRAPAAQPVLTVSLAADGRLWAAGRPCTLDELGTLLRPGDGPSEMVQVGGFQVRVQALVVRLRVDRAAPWLHAQWLFTVLAEQRVRHTRWVYAASGGDEADVAYDLPVDYTLCGPGQPPRDTARVVTVAIGETRPTVQALEAALGSDPPALVEMRAQRGTRWEEAASVFAQLCAARVPQVDLFGCAIPTREVRARMPLPPIPPPASEAGMVTASERRGWFANGRFWPEESELEDDAPDEPEPVVPD